MLVWQVWPQSVTLWMSSGGTMSVRTCSVNFGDWLDASSLCRGSDSYEVLHNDDGENFLMLVDGYKSATLPALALVSSRQCSVRNGLRIRISAEVMLVHQDEAPNIYANIAKAQVTDIAMEGRTVL